MTCMINGFASKKALKEAVANGMDPRVIDPSIFAPWSGKVSQYFADKRVNRFAVVLDHPRRTKFAEFILDSSGRVRVL